MTTNATAQSPDEERANALTHAAGALIALAGGIVLFGVALKSANPWALISSLVFSASMVALYAASTCYHLAVDARSKARWKIVDHCAIYLLIAGTYTPITLIGLQGKLGWSLFATVWALAAAGIVFKLFFTGRFKLVSTLIYVAMGWLVLVAIKPVIAALDSWTLGWLIAGGVFYTAGTLFYHRPSLRYSHAIWHLFVVAGSVCHYIAVLAQVSMR